MESSIPLQYWPIWRNQLVLTSLILLKKAYTPFYSCNLKPLSVVIKRRYLGPIRRIRTCDLCTFPVPQTSRLLRLHQLSTSASEIKFKDQFFKERCRSSIFTLRLVFWLKQSAALTHTFHLRRLFSTHHTTRTHTHTLSGTRAHSHTCTHSMMHAHTHTHSYTPTVHFSLPRRFFLSNFSGFFSLLPTKGLKKSILTKFQRFCKKS